MTKILWHSMSNQEVFNLVKSSKEGLKTDDIMERQKKFGFNKLPEDKKLSKLRFFFCY